MAMNKSISINGQIAVSRDESNKVVNVQFLPDNEMAPVMEQGSRTSGQLQMLRNGAFDYVAYKPKVRANSTLLRKVAHGRLSITKDLGRQLTLKCFAIEGIDWQKAFVTETVEALVDLMGKVRMREILTEALNKLNAKAL